MRIKLFTYFVSFFAVFLWHDVACSQSKSQDVLNYIEQYKDIAMREMQEYKIPASITLAQGLLESGNGKSELAKKSNNHFGIKCHKEWTGERTYHDDDEKGECFRVYDDPELSYRDHSKFLAERQRYAFLFELEITDYHGWAKGLKQAGYATLPVYANVLIRLIEDYNLTEYDQLVVNGKFKYETAKSQQPTAIEYIPYKITDAEVVGKTPDERYIRENNKVKFIYAKEGESVYDLADMLCIYDYQIIKYNNLAKRRTLKDNEIIYIEPKKNKAMRRYKYHTIQKGETLSYVSRLYAVKLESLYKMNGMDETTILHIGDNIRLR
ncbi:MAG: glucosaminidase domain-containing protein [Bacteroidales bacterium]|nr:glucosaminidase domain-containing protein [Bacteroidales bacterium]